MDALTESGTALRDDLSRRYGISPEAVRTIMDAVARGGGQQAQFSHPELGGMGQWSAGGMTMVGDMFNSNLQALVSNLCTDISAAMAREALYRPVPRPAGASGHAFGAQSQSQGTPSLHVSGGSFGAWWPEGLGHPSSTGSQNDLHYAIFPDSRRLAVSLGGDVTIYDTGDHRIGGVSQQQSGDASWTFTSQHGTVYLNELPVVRDANEPTPEDAPSPPDPEPQGAEERQTAPSRPADPPVGSPAPHAATADEILSALERLATLRDKGILDEAEFAAKKADLLSRL